MFLASKDEEESAAESEGEPGARAGVPWDGADCIAAHRCTRPVIFHLAIAQLFRFVADRHMVVVCALCVLALPLDFPQIVSHSALQPYAWRCPGGFTLEVRQAWRMVSRLSLIRDCQFSSPPHACPALSTGARFPPL